MTSSPDRNLRTGPAGERRAGRPVAAADVAGLRTAVRHMASTAVRLIASSPAVAGRRLRGVWWPIIQTSVAAGLAWYITHDLLGHPQPFFAPIAAAVCLSASNLLRGQRAVQMLVGVVLGIGVAIAVQSLAGTGAIAVGLVVLAALTLARIIGAGFLAQGLMFYNQAAASAVLVIAVSNSSNGPERLFDAVVGGGIALVLSILLFPTAPLPLLTNSMKAVAAALRDELRHVQRLATGSTPADARAALDPSEHISRALSGLAQSRSTARQIVRASPRLWRQRPQVNDADRRAAGLVLLASDVVSLGRVVAAVGHPGRDVPVELGDAIGELASALAVLADPGQHGCADAAGKAAQADRLTASVLAGTALPVSTIAAIVRTCAADVPGVIGLAPGPHGSGQAN